MPPKKTSDSPDTSNKNPARFSRRALITGLGIAAIGTTTAATVLQTRTNDNTTSNQTMNSTTTNTPTPEPHYDVPSTGLTRINPTDNTAFNIPYLLYIPDRITERHALPDDHPPRLIVEATASPKRHENLEKHVEYGENAANRAGHGLAEPLGIPIIVPVIPRPPRQVETDIYEQRLNRAALTLPTDDPYANIDEQILAMTRHAATQILPTARDEYADTQTASKTNPELLLNGFSASGTFADRFHALHPNRVLSVTAGGINGVALLPRNQVDDITLPYPIGISDIEALTGTAVNLPAIRTTYQFYYMGENDNNPVPEDDPYSNAGWAVTEQTSHLVNTILGEQPVTDRFPRTAAIYHNTFTENAGNAAFRVYPDTGHTPQPAFDTGDLVRIHKTALTDDESFKAARSDLGGFDPQTL